MSTRKLWFYVMVVVCTSIAPAFVAAQGKGPDGDVPRFMASSVYKATGPVYALAGGEFDLSHDGVEVACLTSEGSVVQLSPNYLTWEAAVRFQGTDPIPDMLGRPTFDIGDVRSDKPGGEIVFFRIAPPIVRVVFHDPNAGWSQEIVEDKSDYTGNSWGARVGDYDPHRPGDEILFLFEPAFDQGTGTLFREVNGIWEEEPVYGDPVAAEVGMDSAAGDFNWERSGPGTVIVTEMGPTYEITKYAENEANGWATKTIWDDPNNAAYGCLIASGRAAESESASQAAGQGKSSDKSAEEVAKELANPNNSLASLTFKNQFRWYEGDLPGANDQDNYTLLFQPVFPFKLGETASGGNAVLFARPAIPFLFDQPSYDVSNSKFEGVSAMGDIGFDVAYGVTEKSGFLWALGAVGTLPTATDGRLGSGQFSLGPNVLLAQLNKWGVYGALVNHQWDITGGGDDSVSVSTINLIFTFLPGGGWNVGTAPIMNYDWDDSQWTIPLNVNVGRTVMMGKTPIKLSLEVNYYVEKPDAFGPEWMIGINITPVVPNFIENWIKGP